MEFSSLKSLSKVYPLLVKKYETFIPDMTEQDIVTKINSLIVYLNNIGKLSNDTATQWNNVMKWILSDGLTESVDKKIVDLVANGQFAELLQMALNEMNVDLNERLDGFETSLSQITKNNLNKLDVFTVDNGITYLDGTKVSTIFNDSVNLNKTFYLEEGEYLLNSPIIVNSEVSFILNDNALIKANQTMLNMLSYNGGGNAKRKIIKGGCWNGDGKATSCIEIQTSSNVTLENMQIMNPITYGLKVNAGYELICNNILFVNTLTTNIEGNTAIMLNTFDAVLNDITITNYTIGVEVKKTANYFNNVHIWGNQVARIGNAFNVGLIDRAGYNFYNNVYFDTCRVSVSVYGTSHFTNCMFAYADNYWVGVTPVYVSNQGMTSVFFNDCGFRFDPQNTSGHIAQVDTGSRNLIHYNSCDFATPTSLSNVPASINNMPMKIYKFKFTFTTTAMGSILAGNSYIVTKDLTASPYNFTSLNYEDTVVINSSLPKRGLIPYITLNNNSLYVELYNPSTSTITPTTSFTVYLTVMKKHDDTIINYVV
jgi:hypothetical protein